MRPTSLPGGEPVLARLHDQALRALDVHRAELDQLVDREVGEVVASLHAAAGELRREIAVHALEIEQALLDALDLLLAADLLEQQRVLGPAAQLGHRHLIETFDLEHLADRDVGHLFQRREPLLNEEVREILIDVELLHEECPHPGGFLLGLPMRLLLGHEIDLPAGQLGGEPDVLPAAADRDREVLLVDDDVHRVLLLVDDDRRDVGRRERADHELGRVVGPEHDVHALAGELLRDRLHDRTAQADAGPDRVDALVVRVDRDLRSHSWVAGRRPDLENALLDLGDLEPEEFDDELGRGAREHELRAAQAAIDAQQVRAHAVADPQVLLRDHLVARQHRFHPARLDDRVAALHPLDRAVHELVAATEEVLQDLLALGVADLLQDHLLRGLRADAAELDRLERLLDVILDLHVAVLGLCFGQRDLLRGNLDRVVSDHLPAPERFVLAGVAVDRDAHVDVLGEALLGRRADRLLERAEHRVLVDVLLARQGIDEDQQFALHWPGVSYSFGTSRARSRLTNASETSAPSTSRSKPSSVAPRRTPTNRRRPFRGMRSRTSARSPTNRRKSAALLSTRSRPGEDTSSRSYAMPSTGRTRWSCRLTCSQSARVIPGRSPVSPAPRSMNTRRSRPPWPSSWWTSSYPRPAAVDSSTC